MDQDKCVKSWNDHAADQVLSKPLRVSSPWTQSRLIDNEWTAFFEVGDANFPESRNVELQRDGAELKQGRVR